MVKTKDVNPTKEMRSRWLKIIEERLPAVDLIDIQAEVFPLNGSKRQFAPEYSQSSYLTMLQQESAIGDYFYNPNSSLKISHFARLSTVLLIQELINYKRYKIETFFLAIRIVDRYLSQMQLK